MKPGISTIHRSTWIGALMVLVMIFSGFSNSASAASTKMEDDYGTAQAIEAMNNTQPLSPRDSSVISSHIEKDYPGISKYVAGEMYISGPIDLEGNYIASVLIEGEQYGEGSYVSAVVSSDKRIMQSTILSQVQWNKDGSGSVDVFADGNHVKTNVIDLPSQTMTVQSGGWDTAINCLMAAGISFAAAMGIMASCAGLCAVTVGAGCVACLAGFAALGGAAAGQCISRAL